MGLDVSKQTGTAYHPIFLKILEDIPGGLTLRTNRIPSTTKEIKKGALLSRVIATLGSTLASAGMYDLIKTAKLAVSLQSANISTLRVYDNQEFKIGEYIGAALSASGAGSAFAISGITKGGGGTGIDLILSATGFSGGTLDKLAMLQECAANDSSYAPLYVADAILRDNVQVRESDLTTLNNVACGVVVRGTVNESLAAYFVTAADKTALTSRVRWV